MHATISFFRTKVTWRETVALRVVSVIRVGRHCSLLSLLNDDETACSPSNESYIRDFLMTDSVDPRERAVAKLEQLGLSEYEADTFVALIQLGRGTAKDVADIGHVPEPRVYDAVETLHDRGLVDVQHATPQTFTTVSHETALRTLSLDYENLLTRFERALEELEPAQPQREGLGVWTTTGPEAITSRMLEFIDETEDELVYMTVDELLTDTHLDHLERAAERGVGHSSCRDLRGGPRANS